MAHKQIGTYSCWSCKKEVPVKATSTGKLSAACTWCDFPHYANEDTEHFKNLLAVTKLHRTPEPAPAPKTGPEPEGQIADHKPEPKKRGPLSMFGGAK